MKNKALVRVLLAAGIILIAGALALTGYNLITEELAGQERDAILSELDVLIPAAPQTIDDDFEAVESGEQSENYETALPTFDEIKRQHLISTESETGEPAPQAQDEPQAAARVTYRTPTVTVDETEYIGKLSMPSIKLQLPIIGSWSMEKLKVAPCLFYGSVYTGDMVLCAHNYRTHFGQISRLSVGNRITFTDVEGNAFAYRVAKLDRVDPDETDKLIESEYELCLFTCTLSGNKRIVIYCELINVNGAPVSEQN